MSWEKLRLSWQQTDRILLILHVIFIYLVLRPGRLDRKIEIPLPNEQARGDILKIHSNPMAKNGEIDYDPVVKLSDGFNGADLRNVCTEAGMFAIREDRDYVIQDDFMKAVRKVGDSKKLESKLDYKKV
eukprot:NODE_33_length_36935_cov_1.609241.p29 type:complete len:129 gc:universal NODE_33_length_36935_cov_1.609241:16422-16808(+)